MIGSFKHRGLKRLFEEDDPRKLPLKGNRKGEWGVTVRANWRMTFRFEEGYALDVNLEDYH